MRDWAFAFLIDRKFIAGPLAGVVCVLKETDIVHEGHEDTRREKSSMSHRDHRGHREICFLGSVLSVISVAKNLLCFLFFVPFVVIRVSWWSRYVFSIA
jgi:hypothetical protein